MHERSGTRINIEPDQTLCRTAQGNAHLIDRQPFPQLFNIGPCMKPLGLIKNALEVLSARPYAYLDDAPLEERRTQAVVSRRWLDPQSAADIGKLDAAAIQRVREEAWPDATNADELHDALLWLTFFTSAEATRAGWPELLWVVDVFGREVGE